MNAPRERDGSQADHSCSAQSLGSGLRCRSAFSGVLLPDSWTITAPNELYRLGLVVCATSVQTFGERQDSDIPWCRMDGELLIWDEGRGLWVDPLNGDTYAPGE